MLSTLNGGVARTIPGQWARWKHTPDVGTIVHILAWGALTEKGADDFQPLPGGLFAQIEASHHEQGMSDGKLMVLTLPGSVINLPRFKDGWDWTQEFGFHLRAPCWDNDGIRLEVVPDDVQDAVRAYITLQISNGAEDLPLVVADGWLC
jgi:hypothetical protein